VPFIATMMLADAAQAVAGKLYILGGGWSITGPDPAPSAIAIYVKVPWDLTNMKHKLLLELMDVDGEPVFVDAPAGRQALRVESEFEVGRPPGVTPGTPIDLSFALNFPPIVLEPGSRYVWRLSINGETDENWSLAFSTRPASQVRGG